MSATRRKIKQNLRLWETVKSGYVVDLRSSLLNGADPNFENVANSKNKWRFKPLHVAAEKGNVDVARVLLLHGADVDGKTEEYGWTALHVAAENGRVEVARLLINFGADVGARAKWGSRPLHLAARLSFEVTAVLLQAGASPDVVDNSGSTALHEACSTNNVKSARLILGCPRFTALGAKDKHGETALDVALQKGNIKTAFAVKEAEEKTAAAESLTLFANTLNDFTDNNNPPLESTMPISSEDETPTDLSIAKESGSEYSGNSGEGLKSLRSLMQDWPTQEQTTPLNSRDDEGESMVSLVVGRRETAEETIEKLRGELQETKNRSLRQERELQLVKWDLQSVLHVMAQVCDHLKLGPQGQSIATSAENSGLRATLSSLASTYVPTPPPNQTNVSAATGPVVIRNPTLTPIAATATLHSDAPKVTLPVSVPAAQSTPRSNISIISATPKKRPAQPQQPVCVPLAVPQAATQGSATSANPRATPDAVPLQCSLLHPVPSQSISVGPPSSNLFVLQPAAPLDTKRPKIAIASPQSIPAAGPSSNLSLVFPTPPTPAAPKPPLLLPNGPVVQTTPVLSRTTRWRRRKAEAAGLTKGRPKKERKVLSCQKCKKPMSWPGHTQYRGHRYCPEKDSAVTPETWKEMKKLQLARNKRQEL